MAKVRSPNYPLMDLGAALEAARPALKAENRNKMSRKVLAGHLGYNSLNGRALGKIGAIRAYGLIDGSGDELRISDDAVTALLNPDKGHVYKDALQRLSVKPTLFQEIQKQYPSDLPSEANLSFWLVQQKRFTQEAAGKAAKTFLATMRLVYDGSEGYNPPSTETEKPDMGYASLSDETKRLLNRPIDSIKPPVARGAMLQEVFNLDEGPVTLSFPEDLTAASYEELEAALKLFLMRAKRRSTLRQMMIEDAGKGLENDN